MNDAAAPPEGADAAPSATALEAAARQRLRQVMEQRLAANLLPHGGRWLTPEELARQVRTEKRRSWLRAFELTLAYALVALVSLVILEVLRGLVY